MSIWRACVPRTASIIRIAVVAIIVVAIGTAGIVIAAAIISTGVIVVANVMVTIVTSIMHVTTAEARMETAGDVEIKDVTLVAAI